MEQDGSVPLCPDLLTEEELASHVKLAELIVTGKEPRLPVQAMFVMLAIAVLDLERRLYRAIRSGSGA